MIRVGIQQEEDIFILSEGKTTSPDEIGDVIIPFSVPWEDNVQLRSIPPEAVASDERKMGTEILHNAVITESAPNNGGEYEIRVIFQEYPQGTFQPVEVKTHGPASFAHFKDPETLLDYIEANR